ncbi:sialate O-acetylesterase [Mariniflexile jejuense]|uniref:Sialate O-acetylesterase n=1 Tax=Mariniflexile jejuense TaxID=1173582 RepID=A0ABW3JFI1_9FLAO
MNKLKIVILAISFLSYHSLIAQIKLPKLISDGMVLQRDVKLPIWGWASANEKITLTFKGKTYKTTASTEGNWNIELPKTKAGGPYSIKIAGKNNIEIKDVLIGDVWLCSGQSNMEHQMYRHDIMYAEDIAKANYPEIRHFKVEKATSLSGPEMDIAGGEWLKAVGNDVLPFSVVSYFFAKKIYEKQHIPIGLINASVGGTPIEAWIPYEGFKQFPDILKTIEENKDTAFVKKSENYYAKVNLNPQNEDSDKGLSGQTPWYSPNFTPKNWRTINIPGYWEDQGIKNLDGVVWFRKEIDIPQSMIDKEAKVFLGRIVDADELYINGVKVGNTTYQYPQRRYPLPKNLLKAGKNVFVIRVTNNSGKGGFVSDKPYYIATEKDTVDLKGYWHYKVGTVFIPFSSSTKNSGDEKPRRINAQNEPSALHNAMVAPYNQYPKKGIIWYQGESNSWQPKKYKDYMNALITGWRDVFKNPETPFIYAQLPNFMDVSYVPSESNWAELRESQLKSLSIPNTAMAVTIDLGEWNDIHPENKKDVGERMALGALKLAYNEDIVYSGPIYKDHKIEGNKIIISFSHIGSGLIAIDGEFLSEFAIAGEDKNFVWAKAKIEGDKVIVWREAIENPKYVRYAWADNPDNPNLYNKEGLPASPFSIE